MFADIDRTLANSDNAISRSTARLEEVGRTLREAARQSAEDHKQIQEARSLLASCRQRSAI